MKNLIQRVAIWWLNPHAFSQTPRISGNFGWQLPKEVAPLSPYTPYRIFSVDMPLSISFDMFVQI